MSQLNRQRKPVNPQMVIVAREARGLTQKQLAAALEVTQGRVSKIEAGLLPVPDDLLAKLSKVLNYPPQFFQQEGAVMGIGIAEIYHRKRQDVSQKLLEKIYANLDIRRRHVAAYLRSTEVTCNVPRLDVDEYNGQVEEIARLVRAQWQLTRGPIKDLTKTLEDAGVIIIPVDFETTRVDAISRWIPGMPPLVFVNENSPKDRLRFSLAHELGHIVMHALPNPDMEEQADRFAAEFLLPERDIRADFREVTLAKLAVLKRYWRVSMAALLKRADDLGAITSNQARYLWTQMARAGYRTREPVELDIDGERPQLINELAEAHIQELGYTDNDLSQLLDLMLDELHILYLRHLDRQDKQPSKHRHLHVL